MCTKSNDTKASFTYDVSYVIGISVAWQMHSGDLFFIGSHVEKPVAKKTYHHSILTHSK